MPHMVQVNSNSFPPGKLECRNHVAVACDNDDYIDKFAQRQPGDIKANSKINALLLNLRNEVRRRQRRGPFLTMESDGLASQRPPMTDQLALPKRKIRAHLEALLEAEVVRVVLMF